MVTAIPLATDKDRRRKMPSGMSGSLAKRASFTKKMASSATPTASVPMVVADPQGCSLVLTMP